jgi:hypothetical protein
MISEAAMEQILQETKAAQSSAQVRRTQLAQSNRKKQAEQKRLAAEQEIRRKRDLAKKQGDAAARASVQKTNAGICTFWKTKYAETRSREGENYRREACQRAGMQF